MDNLSNAGTQKHTAEPASNQPAPLTDSSPLSDAQSLSGGSAVLGDSQEFSRANSNLLSVNADSNPSSEEPTFACPHCNTPYAYKTSLTRHLRDKTSCARARGLGGAHEVVQKRNASKSPELKSQTKSKMLKVGNNVGVGVPSAVAADDVFGPVSAQGSGIGSFANRLGSMSRAPPTKSARKLGNSDISPSERGAKGKKNVSFPSNLTISSPNQVVQHGNQGGAVLPTPLGSNNLAHSGARSVNAQQSLRPLLPRFSMYPTQTDTQQPQMGRSAQQTVMQGQSQQHSSQLLSTFLNPNNALSQSYSSAYGGQLQGFGANYPFRNNTSTNQMGQGGFLPSQPGSSTFPNAANLSFIVDSNSSGFGSGQPPFLAKLQALQHSQASERNRPIEKLPGARELKFKLAENPAKVRFSDSSAPFLHLRIHSNTYDDNMPIFSILKIRMTDPFGPPLELYCQRRCKIFNVDWKFIYRYPGPTQEEPGRQMLFALNYDTTPKDVNDPQYPGMALRDGDTIYVMEGHNRSISNAFNNSVSAADVGPQIQCQRIYIQDGETRVFQRSDVTKFWYKDSDRKLQNARHETGELRNQVAKLKQELSETSQGLYTANNALIESNTIVTQQHSFIDHLLSQMPQRPQGYAPPITNAMPPGYPQLTLPRSNAPMQRPELMRGPGLSATARRPARPYGFVPVRQMRPPPPQAPSGSGLSPFPNFTDLPSDFDMTSGFESHQAAGGNPQNAPGDGQGAAGGPNEEHDTKSGGKVL